MTLNAAEMSVTILGSGTCVPSLKRSACSVLIKIMNDALLLDSGVGTMRRLLEANTEIFDISFVFYSHFHPDHTAELVPFLFSNKYPDGTRRQIPITFVAGKGFCAFYDKLKAAYGHWIELGPGLVNIVELDNTNYDIRRFDHFKVESIPVVHNEESVAFKITSRGGKSVPDSLKEKGHLTPSLAGKIASSAQAKQLVLTHFYPECDDVDIEKECRKTYSGPLIMAEDLIKIEL